MISGMSVLAVIPARGGSKGVPRKNLRLVGGKPLLAWTVEAAAKSRYLDRCILSSEDPEINKTAKSLGCDVPFIRPVELAGDLVTTIQVVQHALHELSGYDLIVILQPTSPLRLAIDIDACLERLVEHNAPACVSVAQSKGPWWTYSINADGQLRPLMDSKLVLRRQDLPQTYVLNGAVYAIRTEIFLKAKTFLPPGVVGYAMPTERSLDIDTELDIVITEAVVAHLIAAGSKACIQIQSRHP